MKDKLDAALEVARGVAELGTLEWRSDGSESAPDAWQRLYGEPIPRQQWSIETERLRVRAYAGRRFVLFFFDSRPTEIRSLPAVGEAARAPRFLRAVAGAAERIVEHVGIELGTAIADALGLDDDDGERGARRRGRD